MLSDHNIHIPAQQYTTTMATIQIWNFGWDFLLSFLKSYL